MPELAPEIAVKRDKLIDLLKSYGSCAVAFSGGLDSTVLAKAAQLALGDRAVAATGLSAALAASELEEAKSLARLIGIRHELIETNELAVPEYKANNPDRCYHCKTELFMRVEHLAQKLNVAVVADGSNLDDRGDYRPGLRAAADKHVKSPLAECGFSKSQIRELAAYWQLPTWDKPAAPCLSSRIAYGVEVTPERLAMIEQAEAFLHKRDFKPLRVRYHRGDVARIEVSQDALGRFTDPQFRREVIEHFKSLGFKYISLDLEGFRSGSLNAVLNKGAQVTINK
jgi:pyridinium-3,5-biscarboxylic acid mononucleotide sulfurtransferase